MRDKWRPMVLYVNVGWSAVNVSICPPGNKPNLMSAWKPLQIPNTSPSCLYKRFSKPSARYGLRKSVAMNLPEPSGSSPALKPPGNIRIWDSASLALITSIDSFNCSGVWLRMSTISVSAPARSKARAESNSQFVPGNTGIRTFGLAPREALRGLACWSWM